MSSRPRPLQLRVKPAAVPGTWGEWVKTPGEVVTRGEVIAYVKLYDSALLARIPDLIAAQRWYNRLGRWLKARFTRKAKPAPVAG